RVSIQYFIWTILSIGVLYFDLEMLFIRSLNNKVVKNFMVLIWIGTVVLILYSFPAVAVIKQVEFDWISASIRWENQVGYLPCKEPFTLKIINTPSNTSKIVVKIYKSEGLKISEIK